ncbi:MAG: serine hydrolase domain-containing protein [Marinicella sp.]
MKNTLMGMLSLLFSPLLLASDAQKQAVDKVFAAWDQAGVPGAALGVIHDGELVYARGYGMANMEYDIPNSADSVFRIGSTSKQFTAACIVLLAEQGKLKLTDTLAQFFPDFPAYAETITVQHLLHHTSGIRDYLTLSYLKGLDDNDYYEDKDVMQWLINQSELNFVPGEEHLYSNSGYWLLGQIVNQVAGMNMADYANQELFEPLGMHSTHFHNDHTQIVKNRASGYVPTAEGGYQISMTTLNMIGDGGIFTSINDIKKWDDAYYDSKVLSKQFWQEMTRPGVLNNGEKIDYAAGLINGEYKGLKTISHGGAFVGFRAELVRFPEQKFSVAVFANRGDARPSIMAYQVADVYLQDHFKAEPTTDEAVASVEQAQTLTHKQLVGKYAVQKGVELMLSIQDDKLHAVQLWNAKEYDLTASKGVANQYQIGEDESITFTFSKLEDHHAQIMTLVQAGQKSEWKRLAGDDFAAVDLNDFVGDYYSKELDVVYHLRVIDDKLTVSLGNIEPLTLSVSAKDQLSYQGSVWNFERTDGKITGFKMAAGRVQNLAFSKQ